MSGLEIYAVQFVGGHADGTEMSVIGLNKEFQIRTMERIPYVYGEWDEKFRCNIETYKLVPGSSIYLFVKKEVENDRR